ncbi:MAG: hypothetical protein J0M29_20775 [Chitinophagales bacterium]|nr:hypothetical protein [Chitinophagales bacterium]
MKKLNLVTSWPLILIALFLGILPSCKKDGINTQHSFSFPENYPISIGEAKAFFEQLKYSTDQQSLGNDSTRIFNLPVVPNWSEAYLSNSLSGRQIVVSPLQDSVFASANDGRAGLRLLVSNLGGDTLNVEIMLFIADSNYFFSNNQDIGFADFSGVYALFDIGFHFKGGVRMVNGAPVGGITSIQRGGQVRMAEEREDGDCLDVIEIIYEPCPDIAVSDCEVPVVVVSQDCVHEFEGGNTGGSTSGGGTGTGTGGGGGGGTGTGTGTGTPPPGYPFANTNWQYIYTSHIPIQWFIQGGGTLPPGLNVEEAEKLRQLYNICEFNAVQLDWLASNSPSIEVLLDFLTNQNNTPNAIEFVKAIIQENIANDSDPTNPPVSVNDPLCVEILNFKTFINDLDHNYKFTGLTLSNSYYTWTVPNGNPVSMYIENIRFTIQANHNNTCLLSSNVFLANAVNTSMATTQQMINQNPLNANTIANIQFLTILYNNFTTEVKNCNPSYSANVAMGDPGGAFGYPMVNLDSEIINCP